MRDDREAEMKRLGELRMQLESKLVTYRDRLQRLKTNVQEEQGLLQNDEKFVQSQTAKI